MFTIPEITVVKDPGDGSMDRQMDGWMDWIPMDHPSWMDPWIYGRINGCISIDGQMDPWTDGCIYESMDGCMDPWTEGWVQIEGQMDPIWIIHKWIHFVSLTW